LLLIGIGGRPTPGWGLDRDEVREAARIVELLDLLAGQAAADVGAGDGEWTVQLAQQVGPSGQVYATEIKEDLVQEIGAAARDAELDNVTAILSSQRAAGLPAACCDAILLRKVYHHFSDPAAMNRQLLQALKPGGRMAVIDYTSFMSERVAGAPEDRSGHGLALEILTRELTDSGFEVVEVIQPWMEESNVYCVILRRADGSG
jgi:predicted methyltransferase